MLKPVSLSIAIFLSVCFTGSVFAAGNDLGSRWPGSADVSLSPYWHVYVFHRSGVEYVQVNDLSGNLRQVVAASGSNFLVLPMGLDATRVATPQEQPIAIAHAAAQAAGALSSQLVYRDGVVTVTVKAGEGGNLNWTNNPTASICQPPDCGNANQQPGTH